MTTANTSTVIALFESRIAAEHAVEALAGEGFTREHISVIAGDHRTPDANVPNIGPQPGIGSGSDAGSGAAVGGLAGFIGGIIALAIPGIGPLIAAGPLAAGLMGAGIGAATGGLAGALKGHGVPDLEAGRLTDAIRRGRVLVSVHAPESQVDRAAMILDDHGALDVDEPAERVAGTADDQNQIRPLSPGATEGVRLQPGEGMVDKYVHGSRRAQVYPGFTGMGPASTT
ncbi:MAG TPA: DUF3341 domain-containing protein [Bryobacteraceae bacterium]|nr:DUF3341 domain-containing protein [Bryobacteraceae bacterium]